MFGTADFAFVALNHEAVDQFYSAGLNAGGKDNGALSKRDAFYYAAYLIDPDGNNVEGGKLIVEGWLARNKAEDIAIENFSY